MYWQWVTNVIFTGWRYQQASNIALLSCLLTSIQIITNRDCLNANLLQTITNCLKTNYKQVTDFNTNYYKQLLTMTVSINLLLTITNCLYKQVTDFNTNYYKQLLTVTISIQTYYKQLLTSIQTTNRLLISIQTITSNY